MKKDFDNKKPVKAPYPGAVPDRLVDKHDGKTVTKRVSKDAKGILQAPVYLVDLGDGSALIEHKSLSAARDAIGKPKAAA